MGGSAERSRRYPAAPRSDVVERIHGVEVADPFRPLEDVASEATLAWIVAQNELTRSVLGRSAARASIRERLAEIWTVPRAHAPWRRGSHWFQLRNDGRQDQDVLWTADAPDAPGRVLFDPNRLGSTTAIVSVAAARSGELVAIALSEAGSDWMVWRVLRTATGEFLPDVVKWCKFAGAAWTADDAGFFYGRFREPDAGMAGRDRDMELRYHRLGSDQAEDPLVLATPDEPEWMFEPEIAADGRTLIVTIGRGSDPETRIHVADLSRGVESAVVRPLLGAGDAAYAVIEAVDGRLYLRTYRGAPRVRVVSVDLDDGKDLREVVPEADDALETAVLVGEEVACLYLHDAHGRLVLHPRAGTGGSGPREIDLPGPCSIEEATGRAGDPELFLSLARFTEPSAVVAVGVPGGTVRALGDRTLAWDPSALVAAQVFVTSADGTRIPLFLVHRRDIVPNGEVRTLLYGYGGFRIPIGPGFEPSWLAWVERGGLLAVASLRGGSEYGSAWHDAGRRERKQNVFDDFAACLDWLARSGWTRPSRIAINGASNGGLLVGAALTQFPERFGAAVPEVGVLDMLRFHRFTIGAAWTSDYGSPELPDEFATLHAYSPLHNVRAGRRYPATLITTGDHDDRVVPGHSFKFAAALQAAQAGDAPILIRIETDAGHGAGKPVSKRIEERTDVLAFLELALDG